MGKFNKKIAHSSNNSPFFTIFATVFGLNIMDIEQIYEIYKAHPVITTDSRNCPEGSIFLALRGASFDGNKFAESALEQGCSYAIVDEKTAFDPSDSRFLLVDDCLTCYKEIARLHRREFSIPVIGITGTNGKTTTKELISAVLAEKYRVLHTEGNFNNDVGVPRTLLGINSGHEIAVIEMGASHPGDIRKLVEYVEPTCGLITNVGMAHLQGFGSFEGVKRTKGELYDFFAAHGGLVFLDEGNPHLRQMSSERGLKNLMTYSADADFKADVQGEVLSCEPFLNFRWRTSDVEWQLVKTQLIGSYNITNMLAAISVGLRFGVEPQMINHALASYTPSNNRSQLIKTRSNTLMVDAYNANPTSMMAALRNFIFTKATDKMAILGDMRELGEASAVEHQAIADFLSSSPLTDVWLVGPEFMATKCSFRKFRDAAEVRAAIEKAPVSGRTILIKGSNGMHLASLVDVL